MFLLLIDLNDWERTQSGSEARSTICAGARSYHPLGCLAHRSLVYFEERLSITAGDYKVKKNGCSSDVLTGQKTALHFIYFKVWVTLCIASQHFSTNSMHLIHFYRLTDKKIDIL